MKQIFTLVLITLLFSLSFAQDDIVCHHFDEKGRTREHTVDFQSMVLHVNFETDVKQVNGMVIYQFIPLRKTISELVLDAPEIEVKEVLLDGKPCKFESEEKFLILKFEQELNWNTTYTLQIGYSAQPQSGLYFLGWDDPTQRARKQIWTQGQGIDNRFWIPSFDDVSDKLTTETFITFEQGYEVISNGDFIEKIPTSEKTTTWHYKMKEPHVMYLVMIAIGEYAYTDMTSASGIVNRQYYYPDRPQEFAPTYQYSVEMMDWMEEEYNVSYPWGKIYRNVPVADFLYGAMENTTSTIFTDYYLQDSREALDKNYIGTNAHELTHQWFGDLITEWNGTSHWLHESFATHYAKHFRNEVEGFDEFNWERYQEMLRAISADNKNDIPIASSQAGSSRHYPKGSVVIDMLRNAAGGDEQYQKVITNYLKKYSFKHVDTHLFQMEFMETLGLNLDWFFDQWIYRAGYPHFEVSYKASENETLVKVKQIQEQNETIGLFKVKANIYVGYIDGTGEIYTEDLSELEETLKLENTQRKEVAYVIFDLGNQVYKKLTFERTLEELVAQAGNRSYMIDRYLALKEMESFPIDEKRNALVALYNKETFYATKAIIIKQLVNDDHKKSVKLIESALLDPDSKVRRACVDYADEIPKKLLANYEVLLRDSAYSTIELAMSKLCKQYPENCDEYLKIIAKDAELNDELNIAYLAIKAKNGDEKAILKLVDYSSQSFEFRTRIKAINMLETIDIKQKEFIANLLNASVSFNKRLAGEGRNTLLNLLNSTEEKYLLKTLINETEFDKNELKLVKVLKEKFEFN